MTVLDIAACWLFEYWGYVSSTVMNV